MNNRILFILIAILGVAIFMSSCSDRGAAVDPNDYTRGPGPYTQEHEFDDQLGFCMFSYIRDERLVSYLMYAPPDYAGINEGAPYPVLFLLAPYGETEEFYFNHGLQDVADRLIDSGEIVPMLILCIDGSNGYGGCFYGDSWAGGRYAQLIGDVESDPPTGTMIDWIDNIYNTISDSRFGGGTGRANRAISGVGMGGYGAMRIAIEYSENFSAVSAVSAPLDFDGATGNGGFVPLFDQVIANLETPYAEMDTSYNDPLRNMFFAAATSFSPHDTGYDGRKFYPKDESIYGEQLLDWHADDTFRIEDLNTYFEPNGATAPIKFHLPFDENGDPYTPIWDLWLRENCESKLADHPGALDATDVLLYTTPDAPYNFHQQTLDFSSYLTSQGIDHEMRTYTGYSDYSATGNRYYYDIMAEILKYHSDRFSLLED